MLDDLVERIVLIEDLFQQAADIEKKLPDREKKMLYAKCGWPDYLYDLDDRKDQEAEPMRVRVTGREIDFCDKVMSWLKLLGMRFDDRTIKGKQIIWAKASRFRFGEIALVSGVPPTTVKRWYRQDMVILAKKVRL